MIFFFPEQIQRERLYWEILLTIEPNRMIELRKYYYKQLDVHTFDKRMYRRTIDLDRY
jgi:hypothetical protein